MNFLNVSNLEKIINSEKILQGISFHLQRRQKLAISGETGSGKTTLLKIIAGLLQPDKGNIYMNGNRILGPDEKLMPGNSSIAYLSQYFELPNHYRVEELIEYENKLKKEDARIIYELCDIEHLLKRKTQHLSGGERQRIAMARVFISSPQLILLDEPFSNLDMNHKNILKGIIKNANEELNLTCILVSHDPIDTLSWADEIIVLKEGKIIQKGQPAEIYFEPTDLYTAGLFGRFNLIEHGILLDNDFPANKLIFRPEDLEISNESNAVKGTVTEIYFMGAYYQIEVRIMDNIIYVNTNRNDIFKGDDIHVKFKSITGTTNKGAMSS